MTQQYPEFQQGLVLLDALIGSFRARGTSFEAFCKDRGYASMNLRNAALGASTTPQAMEMLEEAINAAGREIVLSVYRERVGRHWDQIQRAQRGAA